MLLGYQNFVFFSHDTLQYCLHVFINTIGRSDILKVFVHLFQMYCIPDKEMTCEPRITSIKVQRPSWLESHDCEHSQRRALGVVLPTLSGPRLGHDEP